MSYSVEDARQGLILLVKYLKKVHGRQVVHEINRILGSEHGIKMLNEGTRAIKLDHFYPLLEFAGVEPYQFQKFISVDSYGYLPLYLYEIELLSPGQMRSLSNQISLRKSEPTKRMPGVAAAELPEKRFHMSAKAVADVCWATISQSEDPRDLYHAWTQLSIVARGQAKYSRAASCARRALGYAQEPYQRGKLLQSICYLAQHLFDLKPAREIVREARNAHFDAGNRAAMAQTWIDEAQVLLIDCEFARAITAALEAQASLPETDFMNQAALQQTIGVASINLGDTQGAYTAYENFSQLILKNEKLDMPYCRAYRDYLLAEIFVAEGRFSEASRIFRILHADPGQSFHLMDRVLIALYLIQCLVSNGARSEALSVATQTMTHLRSLTPQTAAGRRYLTILNSLTQRNLDLTMVNRLMGRVRRPPSTLRRRPAA